MSADILRRIREGVGVPGRVVVVVRDFVQGTEPPAEGGPWAELAYFPDDREKVAVCWIDDSFWASEAEQAEVVEYFRDELAVASDGAGEG